MKKRLRRQPQVGDTVRVTEGQDPWIYGTWYGRVIKVYPGSNSASVSPIRRNVNWRVRPVRDEYITCGLFLTEKDKKVVTHRRTKVGLAAARTSKS